jgi:hypothetical protein
MESQRTALKWTAMVSQVTGVSVLFIYLFVYLLKCKRTSALAGDPYDIAS